MGVITFFKKNNTVDHSLNIMHPLSQWIDNRNPTLLQQFFRNIFIYINENAEKHDADTYYQILLPKIKRDLRVYSKQQKIVLYSYLKKLHDCLENISQSLIMEQIKIFNLPEYSNREREYEDELQPEDYSEEVKQKRLAIHEQLKKFAESYPVRAISKLTNFISYTLASLNQSGKWKVQQEISINSDDVMKQVSELLFQDLDNIFSRTLEEVSAEMSKVSVDTEDYELEALTDVSLSDADLEVTEEENHTSRSNARNFPSPAQSREIEDDYGLDLNEKESKHTTTQSKMNNANIKWKVTVAAVVGFMLAGPLGSLVLGVIVYSHEKYKAKRLAENSAKSNRFSLFGKQQVSKKEKQRNSKKPEEVMISTSAPMAMAS